MRHLFLFLISFSATLNAQTSSTMDDPLFGIQYSHREVKFEHLPPALLRKCSDLKDRYVASWVYAHTKSADNEYFIVSGLMPDYDQRTGKPTGTASPDVTGIIVSVRGSHCNLETQDSFYWRTDSPEWKLPDVVQRALAADALRRYSTAFGGKEKFLKRLQSDGVNVEELAPALRQQVQTFGWREVSGNR
jgi:hypothetical protein